MNRKVAVIGAGTMGSGIGQVAATAGHEVVVIDRDASALDRGRQLLAKSIGALVARSRLDRDDADTIVARIGWSQELGDAADAGLIIEAVLEDLDVKHRLFADLGALAARDAIVASNTSSLSISEMARSLRHPERFAGLHFFNPVPAMKLVEVVAGAETNPVVVEQLTRLMAAWGKHAVAVKDVPGFIVNRVARPFYAEAFLALDEGIPAALIDDAISSGGGFRMGPLTLADMIGHDVNYAAARSVFDGISPHARFRPQPAQARLLDEGRLGRKSGRGVYDYGAAEKTGQVDQTTASQRPAPQIAVAQDAQDFLWLSGRLSTSPATGIPAGSISVDGVIVAKGDGRTLDQRREVDVLLDHVHDHAISPVLIASARDERSAAAAADLAFALDKRLLLLPDRPGQIVLRTLAQLVNGAADAVEDGIAPANAIDEAMIHGANYPRGPLAWARDFGPARLKQTLLHIAAGTDDLLYSPSRGLDRL
ncbi:MULTISPECIES: 3-hydroxyacyl-CoA dehydrogenase NAD-binding domain-containing protein [Sphingomonadaceae]|jgi:3-hydroxybutyryl-CoA dehydrogenase|uniref:3-hydroxyacyl-CoA dehydrogenase NAD-binding domain-containing protein n=1 Tax=Sphingomonadales TaxID=204457 RepID=UPI000872F33E|nr:MULTISPECIES: 3-hydroxyacyl-CoA dehydrogenase NAD-binding domain-containing protein [Sphingomonadaceae]HCW60077.1 3-hydroxyacyl-CoA dehydrogenase [Sphingobium sp.]MBN8812680.1 3-hydroxyacyl-CoA dehydrogenase [Sphingomonas sp.]OJY53639.1 MAG: 3-hydroxyacyl-CoA dehydrogenase [Sphingomonas sp. 67-41]RQW44566.1 3-hydroxyacyl-CoA dehydrogenase [Novosphingobium sp. LASN5T]VVT18535.1 3-hydroxyacyl-CoA dehydrogenase [Sphingomonas sp. EC-HK361]|tara:strand:+ start:2297 stop:3739 length:1443 start_codon:yes stop_codon:yes gene_type:complete